MEIPENLRIPAPIYPDPRELAETLAKQRDGTTKESVLTTREVVPSAYVKAMVTIATTVWRLKSRIFDPATGEPRDEIPKEDIRKLARYVDSLFDTFSSIGLDIKDRTGESFDYGLIEKVISSVPQQGLKIEMIIETVRPTIRWNETTIQEGEVIIATPADKKESP